MLPQRLWVPGPLPGLNELINSRGAASRYANPWATAKKKWHSTVGLLARHQGLKPFGPCCWTYLFVEKTRQRDKMNIASAATKLIEDSLKENGYIPNDGWDEVLDYRHHFIVSRQEPGVLLVLQSSLLGFDEMVEILNGKKIPSERQPSFE